MADGLPSLAEQATIWRKLVGARIRADWQYRTSFLLFTVSQFVAAFLDIAVVVVLFTTVDRLAGWSVAEVAFLYGTASLAFGLADVFVSEVEFVAHHIRHGSFDRFLLRPVGPFLLLSCQEFAFRRAGKVFQAALVLAVAIGQLDVDWTLARVAMVVQMVAVGFVIFGGIWVLTSSIAFWAVEVREVANAFTYGGNFVAHYPMEVFSGWLRRLATIVPLAFVSYYPALWVLGREDPHGSPAWLRFAGPLVAGAVVLVARAVWTSGIRHYRSTGS
ncbi:MAG TPA: ABC-2 family transporter protein [Acidimicrobiales bacterium]|nr:ABC-2 family transporter protein [Acidimicrobiales bacterium]